MKRVIKFRYWNDVSKVLVNNPEMPHKEGWTIEQLFEDRGWIWEQFTGLQDKNGVDIYEGDILGGYPHGTALVKWSDEWACFESVDVKSGENGTLLSNDLKDCGDSWKVIGNIHENKELANKVLNELI